MTALLTEGAFLFTDIEGSTTLWDEHTEAMIDALRRHDEILDAAVAAHGGRRVKHTGDGMLAEFADPADAVLAAVDAQRGMTCERWEGLPSIRVRMGVHHGRAERRAGDLFGPHVNRAARLMDAAPGGGILVSETTAGATFGRLPSDVSMVDLGPHRLRTTTQPERVFAIRHPELPEVDPARAIHGEADRPRSEPLPQRSNLGVRLTSFVGRDRERAALTGMLETSRLVTVTGSAGVGKTSLAAETARELAGHFPEGMVAVKLGGAPPGDDLAPHVVDAFGLPAEAIGGRDRPQSPSEAVADHVGPRRLLLLLDNCEHVVDSARRHVPAWLRVCPNLTVAVTSRQPLRLPGELVMPLAPLSLPAGSTPDAVLESGAGRLLLDRLVEARPSLLLTERTAPVVAELCRRLDGLPLALELVGARAVALPIEEILARIDEGLDLLSQPAERGGNRQRTLASAVAWSWDLLTEAERRALARLTVFPATFDLAAAEVVVGTDLDEEPVELVSSLIEQSLVQSLDDPFDRFRLLAPIRDFARHHLTPGEEATCRDRHADLMTGIATAGVSSTWAIGITRSSDHLLHLRADLLGALDRAMDAPRAEWALALSSALGLLDLRTGSVPDAVERIDRALGLDGGSERRKIVALLTRAGVAISRREDAGSGLAAARSAMERCGEGMEDLAAQASALAGVGEIVLGRPEEGVPLLRASRQAFLAQRQPWAIAFTSAALGEGLQSRSPEAARPLFEEAIDGFDEVGDVWGMTWAAAGLSRLLKLEEALTPLRRLATRIRARSGDDPPEAEVTLFTQAAMAEALAGDPAEARRYAGEAAALAGRRSVPYSTALAGLALGAVLRSEGSLTEAAESLDRARRSLEMIARRAASTVTATEHARLEVEYHLGRAVEEGDPHGALALQVAGLRRAFAWAEPWSVVRAMLGITGALLAGGREAEAARAMAYARQQAADSHLRLGPGFRRREWDPVASQFPDIPDLLGTVDDPVTAVLDLSGLPDVEEPFAGPLRPRTSPG